MDIIKTINFCAQPQRIYYLSLRPTIDLGTMGKKEDRKNKRAAKAASKKQEPEVENIVEEGDEPSELFEIRLGHQDPQLDIKITAINLAFGNGGYVLFDPAIFEMKMEYI